MSEVSLGGARRNGALRLADALALAAAPTFGGMALLSVVFGNGPADAFCAAALGTPLSGMATMYLLMAAFHTGPWLKVMGGGRLHPPIAL